MCKSTPTNAYPSKSSSHGGFQLNILSAIVLWLILTTGGGLAGIHFQHDNATKAKLNYGLIIAVLFFNNLNILIALCEIILGYHITTIKSDYQQLRASHKGKEIQAAFNFLLMPLPNPFCGKAWSRMWSTYALYDPSYQNTESFGFFIDVGNGWSTIPPCLLMNFAIVLPHTTSPLLVGCLCLASYWQIMYGTIIYFLSFFYNRRYQYFDWREVAGFVGVSNGIWFVFPIFCIYACVKILETHDFSVFGY